MWKTGISRVDSNGINRFPDCCDCEVLLMPIGNPKPQTVATRKYEEKAGWMSKSYKLKRKIVEDFAQACDKADVSQAGQLMKMMQQFIDEVNNQ